jgi:pimeloyl-ACP methyl ester carboxylesterase
MDVGTDHQAPSGLSLHRARPTRTRWEPHHRPFSMELAAQKVAELIRDHAHGSKATVVGLSEGAQITVQLLATAPEHVERRSFRARS